MSDVRWGRGPSRYLQRALLAGLLGTVLVGLSACGAGKRAPAEQARGISATEGPLAALLQTSQTFALDAAGREALAKFVVARLQGGEAQVPEALKGYDQSVVVQLGVWAQGELQASARSEKPAALAAAADSSVARARSGLKKGDVDALVLEIAYGGREVAARAMGNELSNLWTGLRTVVLRHGDAQTWLWPSEQLQQNLKLGRIRKHYSDKFGISKQAFKSQVQVVALDVVQVHVELRGTGKDLEVARVRPMYRGGRVVRDEELNREGVQALAKSMSSWLETHLDDDGRMTYNWDPGQARETPDAGGRRNNMIRQWMATNALIAIARHENRPELWPRIAKKIDYDLERYYKETDTGGVIEYGRFGRKLGAMSLAAMAIIQHPDRPRWQRQEQGLRATIDSMWHDDGYFDAYTPARGNRNANVQNFYPGECLLLWAHLYLESRDPVLLARYMKSVAYYRDWHMVKAHRKPAFVPWHLQANYLVWTATRDAKLRDFNFEMADWLLAMQQWQGLKFPDIRGRFYDPKHAKTKKDSQGRVITPFFGGPHASATGVYMEGLIDAYQMARELGDRGRAERYRRALVRGARSLRQLQFRDDLDMFYVADRAKTRGGVRTTVYRQEVRVDNVQHGLMALIKMLAEFESREFTTAELAID